MKNLYLKSVFYCCMPLHGCLLPHKFKPDSEQLNCFCQKVLNDRKSARRFRLCLSHGNHG